MSVLRWTGLLPDTGGRGASLSRASLPAVAALLALAGYALPSERAWAQEPTPELEEVVGAVAVAWGGGDVAELARWMAPEGVRLELPGAPHGPLTVRLARAALEGLHDEAGTGPVRLRQLRMLGGDPLRAFAELVWTPVPAGTTEALGYTVFTDLRVTEEGWRIVELRVMGSPGAMDPEARVPVLGRVERAREPVRSYAAPQRATRPDAVTRPR